MYNLRVMKYTLHTHRFTITDKMTDEQTADDGNVDVLRMRAEYYARNVHTRSTISSDSRVINCENGQVRILECEYSVSQKQSS